MKSSIAFACVIALATAHASPSTTTAPGGDQGEDAAVREAAGKLKSMAGRYVDPCYPDDKVRALGRPAGRPSASIDPPLELARYRNAMSCKHILSDHVPQADLETQYQAAMRKNDLARAAALARKLAASVRSVVIDRRFVNARLAEVRRLLPKAKLPDAQRRQFEADIRSELAAGRVKSANLVVHVMAYEVMETFEP